MKNQNLILLLVILLIAFSSCDGRRKVTLDNPVSADYFVGKWRIGTSIYTFKSDSTFLEKDKDGGYQGKWEIDANVLFLENMPIYENTAFKVLRVGDNSFSVGYTIIGISKKGEFKKVQ